MTGGLVDPFHRRLGRAGLGCRFHVLRVGCTEEKQGGRAADQKRLHREAFRVMIASGWGVFMPAPRWKPVCGGWL